MLSFLLQAIPNGTFLALLGVNDPVWELKSPGRFINVIDRWDQLMQKMGDEASALWPNYPVAMPKDVSTNKSSEKDCTFQ